MREALSGLKINSWLGLLGRIVRCAVFDWTCGGREAVRDGYRDLQLSTIFTGGEALSIIAEIQVGLLLSFPFFTPFLVMCSFVSQQIFKSSWLTGFRCQVAYILSSVTVFPPLTPCHLGLLLAVFFGFFTRQDKAHLEMGIIISNAGTCLQLSPLRKL